jgi:ATP-binding cassette subfamily B (MDR/TAP) protein 1
VNGFENLFSTESIVIRSIFCTILGIIVSLVNTDILFNEQKLYEEASQVANDAVGSIRTIASFCSEEKVMNLYKKKCEGPIKTGIRRGIVSGFGFGISFFVLYAVYATSFYAGARLVEDGKASFSDVFRVSYSP